MGAEDKNPNPFEAPAAELASPPSLREESSTDVNDLLLAYAESEFANTRIWIWCVRTFLLMQTILPLVMAYYAVSEAGPTPAFVVQCGVVLIYGAGGIIAWQFASKVGSFLSEPNRNNLEEAFQGEAGYWKFWGLLAFVVGLIVTSMFFSMILQA